MEGDGSRLLDQRFLRTALALALASASEGRPEGGDSLMFPLGSKRLDSTCRNIENLWDTEPA